MFKFLSTHTFTWLFFSFTLVTLMIDSYFYPGAVARLIWLDSRLILLGYAVYMINARLRDGLYLPRFFKYLNLLLFSVFSILMTILIELELFNFSNYVFTTYHLHYDHLFYLCLFAGLGFFTQLSDTFYQRFGKWLILISPLFIWLCGLIMSTWNFDFFLINIQEDQLAEKIQFVLFAFSTILVGYGAHRVKSDNRLLANLLMGISFILFFISAEEISWGQRILNIPTPEIIVESNTQGEITLHNHKEIIDKVDRAYIALGLVASSAWFWIYLLRKRLNKTWHTIMVTIVPAWYLSLYYLLPALFIWHDQYVTRQYKDWREYFELILAVGIFLTAYSIYRQVKRIEPSQSK